jgi:predicted nucleic acid-binding protein
MRVRVFLDTNVFICFFEFPQSNSGKIIGLLNQAEIEAVISERVVQEVQRYFGKYYTKDLAGLFSLLSSSQLYGDPYLLCPGGNESIQGQD